MKSFICLTNGGHPFENLAPLTDGSLPTADPSLMMEIPILLRLPTVMERLGHLRRILQGPSFNNQHPDRHN